MSSIGSKIDFKGDPIFESAASFFVIILKFIFTSIFEIEIHEKKFHFRRPIFNKHHNTTKVIYKSKRDEGAQWLGLWASEQTRVSSSPPYDTLFICS